MEKREIEKSNFFLALQDLFLLCVRNRQKLILLFSPKLTQTQTTFVRCTREIYVWNGKATRAVFSQKKKKLHERFENVFWVSETVESVGPIVIEPSTCTSGSRFACNNTTRTHRLFQSLAFARVERVCTKLKVSY